MKKKTIYNPETTEKINEALIFGGSPSGILNFTKPTYKVALDIWNGMEANTWFPKEANTVADKEPFQRLSDAERRMFDLALAQLIFNDSEQANNLMDNVNPYITDPLFNACLSRQSYEECLTKGHEVLTKDGWVDISKIEKGQEVLSYNVETRTSKFQHVKKKHEYLYSGKLHHFNGRGFEQIVTEGHKIPYISRSGKIKTKLANEFPEGYQGTGFISQCNYTSTNTLEFSYYEKFLIALQADGSILRESEDGLTYKNRNGKKGFISCTFSFSKSRKIDRLKDILENLEFSYHIKNIPIEKDTIKDKVRFTVKVPVDLIISKKFNSWVNLDTVTPEFAQSFVEELTYWDGYDYRDKDNINTVGYDTTDYDNAVIAQTMGVLAWYKVTLGISKDNRKPSYKDVYRLHFNDKVVNIGRGTVLKQTKDVIDKKVYCITVDDSYFIVKYNNKISVTGNCNHSKSYAVLVEDLSLNTEAIYDMHKTDSVLANKNKQIATMYAELANENPTELDIMKAMIANNILEGIVFFGGFTALWSLGNKLKGTAKMISFIARDEAGTHLPLFGNMFQISLRQRPYLNTEELKQTAYIYIDKFVNLEIEWTKYITAGNILGFSDEGIERYCKYRGNAICENLGYPKLYNVEKSPLQSIEDKYCDFNTTRTNFFEGNVVNYSKGSLDLDF